MSQILRLKQVIRKVGLSKSTIYEKMSEGLFPTSIKLSERSVGWLESDINDWISSKINKEPGK